MTEDELASRADSTEDELASRAGGTEDELASRAGGFAPDRPYRRSPSVALRPEPFGALVYHFGTRKLSFLKTPQLVEVVMSLDQHGCVHAAIEAAGVVEEQRPAYLRALAGLAGSGTIEAVLSPEM